MRRISVPSRRARIQRFASKCEFWTVNGQLHGRCRLMLRNGSHVTIETKPGEGVPLALLTHRIARRQSPEVSGFFSDTWKKAKGAASGVAKVAVSKQLFSSALNVVKSDLGSAALSLVPGGAAAMSAVKLGTQAADLLGKAAQGSQQAKVKIQKVVALANAGNPTAIKAQKILKAVHAKGKLKGVFPSKTVVKTVKPARPLPGEPGHGGLPVRAPSSPYFRAVPSVPNFSAPEASRAHGRQGIYWTGLYGFSAAPSVGHWEQWDYS